MKPYPVMMNVNDRQVIVVGGGSVAARKIGSLLESGARVTVISPELGPQLEELAETGAIYWLPEPFDEKLLDRYPETALIFGTTNRREVNIRIHDAAVARKIPCNIADVPELCTFIVPAVITQGDLIIAVSTGGSSPALARRIREDLETRYGPEYAAMTRLMGELRRLVLAAGSPSDENKKLFLEIVDSEILTALRENDRDRALEILKAILPGNVNPEPAMEKPPQ
ncbi:MAG: bifunctional precorrin-2 dehydrogenase/sirohydrochlorin ferrochelatase [Desulfomonile tiedjei]|nr:bifunctional precorrin-2 dehydrogenase/sirohydrochlorin ferrochelatase [Desulfomonile tiedjei]